ncbi:MAG: tRNA (adenosine(37)-N6)-threonylcarbamoyltransferase complex transferase subunit TsaD [Candidatus Pacebacteria bacterium]|jgi:N6-L-threonylcarbamoyladenine synthase|nr:tRNA (adenosine(37)-N6)-threonylcarbamoyltransferase complex transferase subunit TsaD [Parcubacteria group bacterium]MDP7159621.1 tRNA (adenosine(37)-N6)-threonylcarbamoyltransferase complex transferase subunit TsaD [Candidatus Paceibacterota bacterium]MDP7367620.1 tRNA (adenosine(37)-N6)-threonylcarbamoyltransferase complex transferase subunit TsaD [Candidatus Paceibacterota bacterium]MDP7466489.1 tRNA (adenosine(37)-N6)-threonylcarbamoyltransferase complex transferase subunit TsaD [Candidat|tara:strand:+ start:378 stop:1523 length:1146 start_codon:yes stop_codon:yes gene_type:complete
MKILSIETSCDETAISIVDTDGKEFKVLGNSLLSQIDLHKEYGGVFPTLAKREHSRNLIPVLKQVLEKAGFENSKLQTTNDKIKEILNREPELLEQFLKFIPTIQTPDIDAIAVTQGPGLEPALWVGINFAKALSVAWKKPIIPVNHMEGHIFSALLKEDGKDSKFYIQNLKFPILALLISGGHTQLVLSKKFLEYEIIGETLDDAVGEAFDKTARMLGLPYPGGPEISKLAEKVGHVTSDFKFPRPMLRSNTCDFSFSGLKTSVLYTLKKIPELTTEIKQKVAKEFEDAVIEVLLSKTKKALKEHGAQTLVIGGGVSANKRIKKAFEEMLKNEFSETILHTPFIKLSTDNAIMIAVAGYFRFVQNKKQNLELKADGNLSL